MPWSPTHENAEPTGDGAAQFVQSEMFARTFAEGMALVENTANYLDGDGRDASKALSRSGALAYAGVSMRLTTQLMQIASWLLVLRAVREGDMKVEEAFDAKYRLPRKEGFDENALSGELPSTLSSLVDAAQQLYDRIARLDVELFTEVAQETRGDAMAQLQQLRDAFGQQS